MRTKSGKGVNLARATVVLRFAAVLLVFLFGVTGTAWAQEPGSGETFDTGYDLYLICGTGYWASYADYLNHLLSVDYTVGNNGPGTANKVQVVDATADNGVTVATSLPIYLGKLDAGDEATFTLQWLIPYGVVGFKTNIVICTICGTGGGGETANCTYDGIDIKPDSCPNSINLKSKGNVAVAVLSTPLFDATTIYWNSVVFAGAAPLSIGKSPIDVNGDGLLDLVFHFKTQDLNLQAQDTTACLSAVTTGGESFTGCDSVRIVN